MSGCDVVGYDERRYPSPCRWCHPPPAGTKSRQRRICQPDHKVAAKALSGFKDHRLRRLSPAGEIAPAMPTGIRYRYAVIGLSFLRL
ncbi:hypothetical protein KCP73_19660 [Salmonella enterica subsp. enterica]|nr:hypothetical protein KCP73_19660 [Salmonella enterica subsp. enterica]